MELLDVVQTARGVVPDWKYDLDLGYLKHYERGLKTVCPYFESGEPFGFSRFGEGELRIIQGAGLDRGEFYWKGDPRQRKLLIDAFQYRQKDYFVGISPHIAQAKGFDQSFEDCLSLSGQALSHVLPATLFSGTFHMYFLKRILPMFKTKEIVFIGNESARIDQLPFSVSSFYPVSRNAWQEMDEHLDRLRELAMKSTDCLFLIAAGPFSNILVHALCSEVGKNQYVDIGSSLDFFLFGHATRGFIGWYHDIYAEIART